MAKSWYRCDLCGCYLDPGDGDICEECQADQKRKTMNAKNYEDMLCLEDNQYIIIEVRNNEFVRN